MSKIAILISSSSKNCDYTSADEYLYLCKVEPSIIQNTKYTSNIKIFLGYDEDDLYFEIENARIKKLSKLNVELYSIKNISKGNPCYVWNKLYEIAYSENFDYFLQFSDDTIIKTKDWDEKLVNTMKEHKNLGICGFKSPYGNIFMNAFLSRKHYELFGYLYHPVFTNFDSDVWLTIIYEPTYTYFNPEMRVENTIIQIDYNEGRYMPKRVGNLHKLIEEGKKKVEEFIKRS